MKKILVFIIIAIVLNSCCWSLGDPAEPTLSFTILDSAGVNLFNNENYYSETKITLLHESAKDSINISETGFCEQNSYYCMGSLIYVFPLGHVSSVELLINLHNLDYDTLKIETLIEIDNCEKSKYVYSKIYYQDSIYYTERLTGTINLIKKW